MKQMARVSVAAMAVIAFSTLALAASCPNPPVPTAAVSSVPADVCIPAGFTDLTIDFFDDYSWRAFIALTGSGAFESFHSLQDVFHEDGSAPGSDGARNSCSAKNSAGELVFASTGGLPDDIGQTADGLLVAPLVAQNGRYVRYLTGYNEIAYRHIVSNKWYLRSNLPVVPVPRPELPPVQFPDGSIVVKSAWIDLAGLPKQLRARYYSRMALVQDPDTGKCERRAMGLAGLHVVHKTPSRPQWIWTTFEQVDNVPPGEIGKFALHDGSDAPMPGSNPLSLTPLFRQPVKPFNVVRSGKASIHPKTMETNAKYRKLMAGTVWKNYQLVMTQWPLQPGDQSIPVPATHAGDIFQSFPGEGATSAFANVTMETFNQARPAQGCMNCHNRARLGADFMWSVLMHAYPPKK
jgi:hypothetical protein